MGLNPPIASIISFQSSKSNFCFNSFWFRVFDRKRLLNKRPDFAVTSSFKPEQILAEQASFLLRILVYSLPNVKDFQKLIQKFRTCNLSSNLNHLPLRRRQYWLVFVQVWVSKMLLLTTIDASCEAWKFWRVGKSGLHISEGGKKRSLHCRDTLNRATSFTIVVRASSIWQQTSQIFTKFSMIITFITNIEQWHCST